MRIPRLRLLRHWDRKKTSMRGCWLLIIEPRWPIVRFVFEESPDELRGIFPTKEDDTLDVVVEHFDRTKIGGDCVYPPIWHTDLCDVLLLWYKK